MAMGMMMMLGILAALTTSSHAAPVDQVVGTWNVVSKQDTDTCDTGGGQIDAYVWLVSVEPQGRISVNVQGNTAFPTLTGSWDPESNHLTLHGYHKVESNPATSWFSLALKDGKLTGVRRYVGLTNKPRLVGMKACFSDFKVTASK